MKVVTPVSLSPLMTAQLIGAAPLYWGRRAAWRLKVPSFGIDHTDSGSILNATPTTLYPASMRASRGATANSGVPIYTILVFLNVFINLLFIFLHHEPKFSVLNIAESCAAFHVK